MGDVTTFESSFESNGNGRARPMEVIPAGRERRQWTPEAKARIIAESMAPRANVADIARRNDILPQQLYAWRREARERMESDDAPAFVPAMVEEPKAQGSGAEIRINIKGMTIRIPDGVTTDHIERVLLAVQVST
ncbi:IS66-like element accessory protein TnpA [Sphingopyxis sp. H115]|uniref:IS66-like element accessory protein TnpA n=1 Tax=Sphingopyxis sp. H115 TaxID=1759073 RepID=UPI0009E90825|nr:transposase [Sphingopyxis sp. H115]